MTHYDYGFRIYNPSIARFLSVDPLTPDYPELTPYQFASNTPIQAIDLDGLEGLVSNGGEPATLNMTARDGTSLKVPLDIKKFGEVKIFDKKTQPTLSVPHADKVKQDKIERGAKVLEYAIGDPKKLKEGDPLEWAGLFPAGKIAKGGKKIVNLVEAALDVNKTWKSISEPLTFVKSLEKVYGKKALDNYEKYIKPQLSNGEAGGNIHDLSGDLKGWKAIDIPGTGKGRGGGRIIFKEVDGVIDIKGFVKDHNYKNIIE